jgi:phosphoribosyl 1,2-cyclic phosphate phosphodiesterase
MRVRFLGTGTSHGVPVLGCSCPVCTSTDPRDRRFRSSLLIWGGKENATGGRPDASNETGGRPDASNETGGRLATDLGQGESILIDAGPEFRLQGLAAGLRRLDGVLITHAHADHVHGLDDVRPLTRGRPLSVWASEEDAAELRLRFSYAFGTGQTGGGKPRLDLQVIPPGGIRIGRLDILPIPIMHGTRLVFGYRIGRLAYLTDCSHIPRESMALLQGLDVLILDALRPREHPTHLSIEQAFALGRQLSPGRMYLTHLCHDQSHAQLEGLCAASALPFPAAPGYDGLEFEVR